MEDVEGKIFLDTGALNFYACFQGNFEIADYDNIKVICRCCIFLAFFSVAQIFH